jgi:hypothetical protein
MSLDSTGDKSKEELYFINNDPDKWSLLKFLKRKKHSLSAHNIEWKDKYKVYEENKDVSCNCNIKTQCCI